MDFGKCATAAQESKRTTAGTRPAENRHHASWGCLGRRQELQDPTWRGQKGWDRPLDNNFQYRPNHRHAPVQCGLFSDPVGQGSVTEPLNKSPTERVWREMRMMVRRATKGRSQTAQRGAGAPLGMRPWSGMQVSGARPVTAPFSARPLAGAPRAAVPGATTMPRSPAPPAPHFAQIRRDGAFRAPGIVVPASHGAAPHMSLH